MLPDHRNAKLQMSFKVLSVTRTRANEVRSYHADVATLMISAYQILSGSFSVDVFCYSRFRLLGFSIPMMLHPALRSLDSWGHLWQLANLVFCP